MIDEKKLIEILKKREELIYPSAILEVAGGHEIYDERSFGRYSELGIISNIIERLAEENKGGWIPISERLPETYDNVLICQRDGYVNVAWYSLKEFKDMNSYPYKDVIAWQPLPEPYLPPVMTNADRIRNMTDEELAKFIHAVGCNSHFGDDCGFPFCHSMKGNLCHGIKDNTDARTLEWLKSEVVKE